MKRKSGLQKRISSIFRNLPVDDLGSDTPLPVSEQEQLQNPCSESAELTSEGESRPIIDPPDFTVEKQGSINQDQILLPEPVAGQESIETPSPFLELQDVDQAQEDTQAESEQNEKVREITDDGLSYFSFTSDEQAQEDSTSDESLEQVPSAALPDEPSEVEETIQPVVSAPLRAARKRHNLDKRRIVMVSMVGILSVVFIIAMLSAFAPSLFEDKPQVAIDSTDLNLTPLPMVQSQALAQVWPKPKPFSSDLRDPMVPVALVTAATVEASDDKEELNQNLNIIGIVYSEDKPSVIIGQKILFVGDRVEGVTIISISKTEVVFEVNGQQWTQSL